MDRPTRAPKSPRRLLSRLSGDVRGATAIEYGLIVAVIVIAMIASFTEVAKTTIDVWNNINTKVTKAR
ncbi:Flp family type IVb pilin [Sphingomonas sp. SUN019]|uniref:Flp family type IVb pilin n=1 Tax=Sphingomonas sp. SUN019 TaxID=2937788 RepID=UPI002164AB0E|nr:Flp family type IVb pilin [Sphingomonas sp. SUN019]UVO49105.1 Flp family type IVb pilin [Sphingomonas sp. SUN019]